MAKSAATLRAPKKSARRSARLAFRSDLHAAAEAVFAEKGFAATKMTDIAERAGVAVGTLYNYFPSKEEIFQEIFATRSREFARRARAGCSGSPVRSSSSATSCGRPFAHLDAHSALFAMFVERGAHAEYDLERIGGPVVDREYERFLATARQDHAQGGRARSAAARYPRADDGRGAVGRDERRHLRMAQAAHGAAVSSAVADELLTLFLSGARAPS